ncbi:MAG: hydrogenase, partial [Desulfobacterales bacterium]
MNLFFLSLAIIFCGGLISLVFWRQFALMKTIGVIGIGGGCLLGLIDAGTKLFRPGPYTATFEYLNAFSLSFQIDALSAFFLVAIYAVCLLAALYSYHYMDDSQKALRTAGNFFFFSLLTVFMALVVTAGNLITFMLSWEIMS